MNYYKVTFDYEQYDHLGVQIKINDEQIGFNRYIAETGVRICAKEIVCEDWAGETYPLDYIPNDQSWPIISGNAKTIFEQFSYDVEFIPIIFRQDNRTVGFLFNPLKVLSDAIDTGNSIIKQVSRSSPNGQIAHTMFIKVVLKSSVVGNCDIFRVADNPMPIYVSERVKRALSQTGMKGFAFSKIRLT